MFQFRRPLLKSGAATIAALQVLAGVPTPAFAQDSQDAATRSPIKHVIVIIGENRSFDHIFATYKPLHGQSVDNLLSKKIITADGKPGPNYSLSEQYQAEDWTTDHYQLSPPEKTVYGKLPAPLVGGPTKPYISSLAQAKAVETGLPNDQYYKYLTTGGTGLTAGTPDTRIPDVNNLPLRAPADDLRFVPGREFTSPLRGKRLWFWIKAGQARSELRISPAVEALGMWESRRDFQEEWEGWKTGFMVFHAFHSSAFPTLAVYCEVDAEYDQLMTRAFHRTNLYGPSEPHA